MYKEFEVNTIGYDGKDVPTTFSRGQISYYRAFVESSDKMGDKPKLITMVYLVGSVKGTKVNCSYDEFKRKIKDAE